MKRIASFVAVALLHVSSLAASAQDNPHVITGVVRDAATGQPLSGAVIDIDVAATRRVERTDQVGVFRMGGVPAGAYRLGVHRIGYAPLIRDFRMADRDTSIDIPLRRIAQTLDTVRTLATSRGIYGTIGSAESLRPISGAKVQILGAARSAETDSVGNYYIDVRQPRTYMVRISRAGYANQLISVDVPDEHAVELSALLDSSTARGHAGDEALWADFDKRAAFKRMNAAVIPAAELKEYSGSSLTDVLRGARSFNRQGLTIGPTTCVFVNGVAKPDWPLDAFPVDKIIAVEVYGSSGDETHSLEQSWPHGALCGQNLSMPHIGGRNASSSSVARWVVIWTEP